MNTLTLDAVVAGLEVRGKVSGARLPPVQVVHVEPALVTPGAHPVEFCEHVRVAADRAVVRLDAVAEAHASVLR